MEKIAARPAPMVRQGLTGRGWAAARRLDSPLRHVLRTCAARPATTGAAALIAYYLFCYLGDPALPGNDMQHPLGWWSWWDQGKYLDSALALARRVLTPDQHWYALGYPALAAPFLLWSRGHPFLPVNLASLLLCMAGFLAFARRAGVGRGWAVALFLLGTASSRTLFEGWLIPWNTIPTAACIWLLLAATAAHMAGERRPLLIGLLAAAIPLLRPTEAVLAVPCVLAAVAASLWPPRTQDGVAGGGRVRDVMLMAAGGLLLAVPYGLLHWRIYGLEQPPYLAVSTDIGFTFQDLGWKAYILLADPREWFLDGHGLLWPAPYVALAGAGLVVAWAHGRATGLLAVLIGLHGLLYLSYVDLLPVGLWRYFNVHYWQWALPGLALLAFLVGRDLLRWRRAPLFPLAPLAAAATLPLMLLRAVPVEVPPGTPAKMLTYAGTPPKFATTYFGDVALRDSVGEFRGVGALRAMPVPGGMRVFAMRRPFGDNPVWVAPPLGWTDGAPPVRYGIEWRIGVPCWTRLAACQRLGQSFLPAEPTF